MWGLVVSCLFYFYYWMENLLNKKFFAEKISKAKLDSLAFCRLIKGKIFSKKSFPAVFFILMVATGLVLAFYGDLEKSLENFFDAGEINLLIGNESYFNGQLSASTTWDLGDLTAEKFFEFRNLKPGDWGEDTISLEVKTNPAWVCANITLSESADNGLIASEAKVDSTDGKWAGEVGGVMDVVVWADDGDNVLEQGEKVLMRGKPDQLPQGDGNNGMNFRIADSVENIFGSENGLQPGKTYHIGKAWCIGQLTLDPVLPGDNNPTQNSGIKCDGRNLDNRTQSDSLKGIIKFWAKQTRHNDTFYCSTSAPQKYNVCNQTEYKCEATREFENKIDCEKETGKTCYLSGDDCLKDCKAPPQEYFVCNPCAQSCSKTISYESQDICTNKEGKQCYTQQSVCDNACQKPTDECATPFSCAPQTQNRLTVQQLTKRKNCDGTYSYIYKVTNNNTQGLSHFAIELPCGITPVWPLNGATYKPASSTHSYKVENPSKDPLGLNVWSIKYEDISSEGIKNGESDIFEFRVGQYIQDVEVDVQTKWATNRATFTFNCTGTECPECKKYYSCNNDCYTCDQTLNGYLDLNECKQKTGADCYEGTADCMIKCKPQWNATEPGCSTSGSFIAKWAAEARYGDSAEGGGKEIRLLNGSDVQLAGADYSWQTGQYSYEIEHFGSTSNKVKFTVRGAGGEKYVSYQPLTNDINKLKLAVASPSCGLSSLTVDKFVRTQCEDSSTIIGKTISISSESPACEPAPKYMTISGTGLDFSKPFKITGTFRFNWIYNNHEESLPSLNSPMVKIIFGK